MMTCSPYGRPSGQPVPSHQAILYCLLPWHWLSYIETSFWRITWTSPTSSNSLMVRCLHFIICNENVFMSSPLLLPPWLHDPQLSVSMAFLCMLPLYLHGVLLGSDILVDGLAMLICLCLVYCERDKFRTQCIPDHNKANIQDEL